MSEARKSRHRAAAKGALERAKDAPFSATIRAKRAVAASGGGAQGRPSRDAAAEGAHVPKSSGRGAPPCA